MSSSLRVRDFVSLTERLHESAGDAAERDFLSPPSPPAEELLKPELLQMSAMEGVLEEESAPAPAVEENASEFEEPKRTVFARASEPKGGWQTLFKKREVRASGGESSSVSEREASAAPAEGGAKATASGLSAAIAIAKERESRNHGGGMRGGAGSTSLRILVVGVAEAELTLKGLSARTTVRDAIVSALRQYAEQGCSPALGDDASEYELRMLDGDEADMDFPPLKSDQRVLEVGEEGFAMRRVPSAGPLPAPSASKSLRNVAAGGGGSAGGNGGSGIATAAGDLSPGAVTSPANAGKKRFLRIRRHASVILDTDPTDESTTASTGAARPLATLSEEGTLLPAPVTETVSDVLTRLAGGRADAPRGAAPTPPSSSALGRSASSVLFSSPSSTREVGAGAPQMLELRNVATGRRLSPSMLVADLTTDDLELCPVNLARSRRRGSTFEARELSVDPSLFQFTAQSASEYKEWTCIKVNRHGTRQERIIGIDAWHVYNKTKEKKTFSLLGSTKKQKRLVSSVQEVEVVRGKARIFRVVYGEGAAREEYEFEVESNSICAEIVARISFLKALRLRDMVET